MAKLLSAPIVLPQNLEVVSETPYLGRYVFRPLEAGYGTTIGNALRRVLLSSIEGYAIVSLKVPGVLHEFSTIPGVIEDVVDIVLNLKQVALRPRHDKAATRLFLEIKGQSVFTAGDIAKQAPEYEIANPELVIMHLDPEARVQMELQVARGRGYHLAEENKQILRDTLEPNEIVLDTSFSPILRVVPRVETMLYEGRADYEQLFLEIETKGTISPRKALEEAVHILLSHFSRFLDEKARANRLDPQAQSVTDFLALSLEDSPLASVLDAATTRAFYSKGIRRVIDLVALSPKEIEKFYPRIGKKTLEDIQRIISEYDLKLGMDLSSYRNLIPS